MAVELNRPGFVAKLREQVNVEGLIVDAGCGSGAVVAVAAFLLLLSIPAPHSAPKPAGYG